MSVMDEDIATSTAKQVHAVVDSSSVEVKSQDFRNSAYSSCVQVSMQNSLTAIEIISVDLYSNWIQVRFKLSFKTPEISPGPLVIPPIKSILLTSLGPANTL